MADEIGGPAGKALLDTVSHAYSTAVTPAFLVAAGLALAAAAMVWAWIPRDLRPTENAH